MSAEKKLRFKDLKRKSGKVVKVHYFLLVLLCLIAVMWGTETESYSAKLDTYAFRAPQILSNGTVVGGTELTILSSKNAGYVDTMFAMWKHGIEREDMNAEQRMEMLRREMTGPDARARGLLAKAANNLASGNVYVEIARAVYRIFQSEGAVLIFLILGAGILYGAVWIFVFNLIGVMFRRMLLEMRLYTHVPVQRMLFLYTAGHWCRSALTMFLENLYLTLWSLTVIGGIIKSLSYFAVPYIVAENPSIRPNEAITLSRRIMQGHKWELFLLELSFLPWYLLSFLTAGFSDVIYGMPYRFGVYTEYYVYLRASAKRKAVEGTENLDDAYLYEKASEEELEKTYSDVTQCLKAVQCVQLPLSRPVAFFVRNFGLWIGSPEEKELYQSRESALAEIRYDADAYAGKAYPIRLEKRRKRNLDERLKFRPRHHCYTFKSIVLLFVLMSAAGWLWEVSLHLVQDGLFVNRGVLFGPWLPIYGAGSALVLMLGTRLRKHPAAELLFSVVICGATEYLASYVLEKCFDIRWWDYSGYYLNINGRICAEALLIFGIGSMLVIYLIAPFFDRMLGLFKPKKVKIVAIILTLLILSDFAHAIVHPNTGAGISDYSAFRQEIRESGN